MKSKESLRLRLISSQCFIHWLFLCGSWMCVGLILPCSAQAQCFESFHERHEPFNTGVRSLNEIDQISIGTFNVRKLSNHELKRMQGIVDVLMEEQVDIVVLEEVADFDSYRALLNLGLGLHYRGEFFHGQKHRHIHSAVIIKKHLPFEVEKLEPDLGSWLHPGKGGRPTPLFPRGLPILRFVGKGEEGQTGHLFTLLMVHLKSKNTHGKSFDPNTERMQQIHRLSEIVDDLRVQWGERLLIAGDFNADLSGIGDPAGKEEFKSFWDRGFINTVVDGHQPLSPQDRFTHIFRPHYQRDSPLYQQLDGILVTKELSDAISESKIRRHVSNEISFDDTYPASGWFLSDHFFLFTKFRFDQFLKEQRP